MLLPNDAEVVALGETVYAAQCAACHGASLEGQPNWRERGADGRLPAPPHDATGHTWHHPDAVLFELTKHGLPKEIGNGEPYDSNIMRQSVVPTTPRPSMPRNTPWMSPRRSPCPGHAGGSGLSSG